MVQSAHTAPLLNDAADGEGVTEGTPQRGVGSTEFMAEFPASRSVTKRVLDSVGS